MEDNKKIFKTTFTMVWPAVLESFFFALAGIVDSYMVSSLGHEAVAGVGITLQPKFMFLSICFALNLSLSALVARRLGENKREEANRVLVTGISFIIMISVVISIISVGFADSIMKFCGSTPETHEYAVTYFRIIMGGMIFNSLQMAVNSAQRGAGNTRITMRTNVVSNTINIIFNYLLIGGNLGFPRLGITGAALATVLGTVVAGFMSVYSIYKKDCFIDIIYIIKNKIKPSFSAFKRIVRVGYGVFFEQILIRVGFLATAIMAAKQGNAEMAAHQVGMYLLSISFSLGDGLHVSAVALVGKSLGEKKKELAKKYAKTCLYIGMAMAVTLSVFYFFAAKGIFSLFFKEANIVNIGVDIIKVLIFILIFQIPQVVYSGVLRGAGDTLYTAISSTISVTVIRTLTAYFFAYAVGLGIVGIWFGILGDQISRFILYGIRFRQGKWLKIKI